MTNVNAWLRKKYKEGTEEQRDFMETAVSEALTIILADPKIRRVIMERAIEEFQDADFSYLDDELACSSIKGLPFAYLWFKVMNFEGS